MIQKFLKTSVVAGAICLLQQPLFAQQRSGVRVDLEHWEVAQSQGIPIPHNPLIQRPPITRILRLATLNCRCSRRYQSAGQLKSPANKCPWPFRRG